MTMQERESAAVEELAQKYVAKGYAVSRGAELPGVGHADLLATRGEETILVEVRSPSVAARAPSLADLARYAQRQGWQLVIAVTDGQHTRQVELPSVSDIRARVAEASALDTRSPAYLLLSWSVLEAAARVALARGDVALVDVAPHTLVQQLAHRGLISIDEEHALVQLQQARNRAAHGQWRSDESTERLAQLLSIATRLLETDEVPTSAVG